MPPPPLVSWGESLTFVILSKHKLMGGGELTNICHDAQAHFFGGWEGTNIYDVTHTQSCFEKRQTGIFFMVDYLKFEKVPLGGNTITNICSYVPLKIKDHHKLIHFAAHSALQHF